MELTEEDNQNSLEFNPDDPSHQFDLGKLLWERGVEWREKAAEHFLKAAKLNPQSGEAFKYLGHYYGNVDIQRAVKCYQRAVSLNPDDSDAGEALCNLLDKDGKESLEVALCKEASSKSPRAFWAFSRMGCLLVHQKKWSEAVQSLQHAIRGYPSSADLWEALGLSYQRLGMYTAAIKSYARAMELESSRTFAMVESGNIYLMLGWYRKGIDQFREALEIRPQCTSGQYGLAFGLLALSKECIKQGAFSWASSMLEEASKVAEASTHLASNMSCLWKLHADIKLTYAKSFPWTGEDQKDEVAFSNSLLSWKETRYSAAMSGKRSYQRALHLAPWQANIYMDIAVAINLISSLKGSQQDDLDAWNPAEKMLLGSLLLESDNYEFWMALGCVSGHKALRQHSFIRGLRLDVSLASAWAYLGKLYKEEGESQLGRQAFDRARSIDPSLALPWAGMSAEIVTSESSSDEAYDSCLRAVQILPLAEFQIGLAKLARISGHLLSSEVFGAIRQAVQCAPSYPESHNICGLVYEGRHDYEGAVTSYQLARCAWKISAFPLPQSYFADISVNLARALCKAGNVLAAVRELEHLKERGLLNVEGLQVYAVALWNLGKNDLALSAARDLAKCVPTINMSSAAAAICLICALLYSISGAGSATNSILKMPRELLQSAKVSFVVSAVDVVDQTNQLQAAVSSSRGSLSSQEEIIEMHLLVALGKLIRNGSGRNLSIQRGIDHLRKALHMYPNASSLRNMLGYLLLSREQWDNNHVIRRCCSVGRFESLDSMKQDFRSAREVIGAEAVACDATTCCKTEYSLSTCKYQSPQNPSLVGIMQRWFRQEPWNPNARYFLVLALFSKSRRTKFPRHLINVVKRMISTALINQLCLENIFNRYMKFQLLLCSSELTLRDGDIPGCISYAKEASTLSLPDGYTFFAHLQLCRAHIAENNHTGLSEEFMECLKLKTHHPIGWITLKTIESRNRPQNSVSYLDSGFRDGVIESKGSWNSWWAVYNFLCGLISQEAQNFKPAEEFLAEACSLVTSESCFFLCHGIICLELAKTQHEPQYINLGIRSYKKALEVSSTGLPFINYLIAQAEASLGSKAKWERSLCYEWSSWPPEMRPAELYFQMHLLGQHGSEPSSGRDAYGDPRDWILRAIHLNPSCSRYWKILLKYVD
ncbi:tetratricopeptide repeat protein SKI3 [Silene latifolia]|uniref:tetratricopeptide repeat protein SKI3 n=1 Tax=Silene latifolia TaxID=37657 RepID=UPI003D770049